MCSLFELCQIFYECRMNSHFYFSGSNTGIGKTTAIDLARRGARVILACRSKQRGEAALEDVKRVSCVEEDSLTAGSTTNRLRVTCKLPVVCWLIADICSSVWLMNRYQHKHKLLLLCLSFRPFQKWSLIISLPSSAQWRSNSAIFHPPVNTTQLLIATCRHILIITNDSSKTNWEDKLRIKNLKYQKPGTCSFLIYTATSHQGETEMTFWFDGVWSFSSLCPTGERQ